MTRTLGIILIVVALGVCIIGSAFLGMGAAGLSNVQLQPAAAALGFGLLFVFIVAPLAGGGVYALVRGRKEQEDKLQADAQRKILDMVKTRGKVDISEVVVELQLEREKVKDHIYKLVGMGVFSGYVNWDEGMLYSAEASSLRGMEQCKNCGGDLKLAGKGVIKCPYCGTEYFLS